MDGIDQPEEPPLSPGETIAKTASIEIDFAAFDRNTLEFLISESCDKDISVNDVIIKLLKDRLDNPAVD